jgi:hypothetical protein
VIDEEWVDREGAMSSTEVQVSDANSDSKNRAVDMKLEWS